MEAAPEHPPLLLLVPFNYTSLSQLLPNLPYNPLFLMPATLDPALITPQDLIPHRPRPIKVGLGEGKPLSLIAIRKRGFLAGDSTVIAPFLQGISYLVFCSSEM